MQQRAGKSIVAKASTVVLFFTITFLNIVVTFLKNLKFWKIVVTNQKNIQ